MTSSSRRDRNECACPRPHYQLQFFHRPGYWMATRGEKPVVNAIAEGWSRIEPDPRVRRLLTDNYDRSHRFDWLHTPTYLDDRETHLRMKAMTARD